MHAWLDDRARSLHTLPNAYAMRQLYFSCLKFALLNYRDLAGIRFSSPRFGQAIRSPAQFLALVFTKKEGAVESMYSPILC
jgi:hypothetical protein